MGRVKKRGPGASSLLVTPDRVGNVVGIDPHKRTLSATVLDARAGVWVRLTFASRVRGIVSWRRGRGSLGRSPAGGSRARLAGAGTRRCS